MHCPDATVVVPENRRVFVGSRQLRAETGATLQESLRTNEPARLCQGAQGHLIQLGSQRGSQSTSDPRAQPRSGGLHSCPAHWPKQAPATEQTPVTEQTQ